MFVFGMGGIGKTTQLKRVFITMVALVRLLWPNEFTMLVWHWYDYCSVIRNLRKLGRKRLSKTVKDSLCQLYYQDRKLRKMNPLTITSYDNTFGEIFHVEIIMLIV